MGEVRVISDARQSKTALKVQRGVMRMLRKEHDFCCFAEVSLANSRRCDIVAIGPRAQLWIVEIKSSIEDFRVDNKWHQYKDYCDQFYFAKPAELSAEIFPQNEGLIVADNHGARILRPSPEDILPAARRKAMMIKLARLGADRVHNLMDPGPG